MDAGTVVVVFRTSGVKSVESDLDKVTKQSKKTAGSISGDNEKSSKSFVSLGAAIGAVAGIVGSVFTKAMSVMSQSMDSAIKRVDIMNAFPKVMENMGISTNESSAAIKTMADRLKGLPTALDQMALSVQRIASKTGNVTKATDIMLAFNDAVLAGRAPTELQAAAIEQFAQAFAKGKPDMMEWRSMMSAMPGQMKQIAKAMGYVDADALGDALRNGKVSMEEFSEAVVRLDKEGGAGFASFADQARTATGGIETGIANMKTAIVRGLSSILESFGSRNISNAISSFGSGVENVLKKVASLISNVLSNSNFQSFVKSISDSFSDMVKSLKPVVPIIKDVAKVVGNALMQSFKSIASILPSLGPPLVDIIRIVGEVMKIGHVFSAQLIGLISNVIKPLTSLLPGLAIAFAAFKGMNFITDVVQNASASFMKFTDFMARSAPVSAQFSEKITQAGVSVAGLSDKMGKAANFLAGPWGLAIGAAVAAIASLVSEAIKLDSAKAELNATLAKQKSAFEQSKIAADNLRASEEALKNGTDNLGNSVQSVDQANLNLVQANNNLATSQQSLQSALNGTGIALNANNQLTQNGVVLTDEQIRSMPAVAEQYYGYKTAIEGVNTAQSALNTSQEAVSSVIWKNIEAQKEQQIQEAISQGNMWKTIDIMQSVIDSNGKLTTSTGQTVQLTQQEMDSMLQTLGDRAAKVSPIFQSAWQNSDTATQQGVQKMINTFSNNMAEMDNVTTNRLMTTQQVIKAGTQKFEDSGGNLASNTTKAFGKGLGLDKSADNSFSGFAYTMNSKDWYRVGSESASKVSRGFNDQLKIKSPSRVMMQSGLFFAEGVEIGIEKGTPGMVDAAVKSAQMVMSGFEGNLWNPDVNINTDGTLSSIISDSSIDNLDSGTPNATTTAPVQQTNIIQNQVDMNVANRDLGRMMRRLPV